VLLQLYVFVNIVKVELVSRGLLLQRRHLTLTVPFAFVIIRTATTDALARRLLLDVHSLVSVILVQGVIFFVHLWPDFRIVVWGRRP